MMDEIIHFNSFKELDNYADKEIRNARCNDQNKCFVSCSAYGELRRGKDLFGWENPPEKNLYVIAADLKDTLIMENPKGMKFKIPVKSIPIRNVHSVFATRDGVYLTVFDEQGNRQSIKDIGIIKKI